MWFFSLLVKNQTNLQFFKLSLKGDLLERDSNT